jgi:hypothetical protein
VTQNTAFYIKHGTLQCFVYVYRCRSCFRLILHLMRNSYDSLGVLVVSEVLSYGPVLAIQNQSFASVLICVLVKI